MPHQTSEKTGIGTTSLTTRCRTNPRESRKRHIQKVRGADDLSHAFEAARAWHTEAVNVLASPLVWSLRQLIIDRAARRRLPAIYQWGEAVRDGGLLSYGPIRAEVFRALTAKIDRVLTGAKPSDLPVEQPTKFELVINRASRES